MLAREKTRPVAVGSVTVGGGAPVSVQSMTNTPTASVEATLARTQLCPFGHTGNCQDCEVHCQRGEARERIRAIMRYAAPRMVLRHPLMTCEYLRKKIAGKMRTPRG